MEISMPSSDRSNISVGQANRSPTGKLHRSNYKYHYASTNKIVLALVDNMEPTTSTGQSETFDESILHSIHKQMDGETASDAQRMLKHFIGLLTAENEQLDAVPKHKKLSLKDTLRSQQVSPYSLPSSELLLASASVPSNTTIAAEVTISDVAAAAIASTLPNDRVIIVTQTVYVTATPYTVTTTATASAESTDSGSNTGDSGLLNNYNSHPADTALPVIILLAVFGTILVIGMLLGAVWWRSQSKQRKRRSRAVDSEMEEQHHRRPPTAHTTSAQQNISGEGINTSQHQNHARQSDFSTKPALLSNSSRRPSMTPSINQRLKSFKGKGIDLPLIDTASTKVEEEDPPISPTFVPLPGTPMRLVSRQQVYQDPQRRRGVDALDLAAQQESNQKHWKSVNSVKGPSSIDQPKSADQLDNGMMLFFLYFYSCILCFYLIVMYADIVDE
jgi:hypothetical protein